MQKKTRRSKTARPSQARQEKQKLQIGLVVILLAAVLLGAIFLSSTGTGQASQDFPAFVSVQQAYELYQQEDVFVLDVREPFEWDEVRIPNTTLIPLGQLVGRVNEVPKDAKIVVICRSGNRSQEGRDILLQAGFENVTSMNGGVVSWRSMGYPTIP